MAAGEGALTKVGKGVTSVGKGKNPLLLQMGGLESCKGGTGLCEDSASPFLISLKCSRTEPSPAAGTPLQKKKSFYIYIKKQTLYQYFSKSGTKIQYKNTASSIRLAVTAAVSRT